MIIQATYGLKFSLIIGHTESVLPADDLVLEDVRLDFAAAWIVLRRTFFSQG